MNNFPNTPQTAISPLKCFSLASPEDSKRVHCPVVEKLNNAVAQRPIQQTSPRLESFARVIPLLICGEQSAINVFGTANQTPSKKELATLVNEFFRIENEEAGHELLWQSLSHQLPAVPDRQFLRRRAALFFAKLGRSATMAEHFAQVSQLDSAVGTIMWHLERSEIATDKRVRDIANHIKRDEARHVAVSKKFAFGLGISRSEYAELGARIRQELVALLLPIADSIEGIGIDADVMFRKIVKH